MFLTNEFYRPPCKDFRVWPLVRLSLKLYVISTSLSVLFYKMDMAIYIHKDMDIGIDVFSLSCALMSSAEHRAKHIANTQQIKV